MKATKFKTYLPCFVGFYESYIDFDNVFENEMYEVNSERKDNNLKELDFYSDVTFDYRAYSIKVSQLYCEVIQSVLVNELGINCKIKYESLYSPKEYNFSTDSVNIEIKLLVKEQKKLDNLIKKNYEMLKSNINDTYTSRDGFCSFHSNDITDWLDVNSNEYYLTNKNNLGQMLEFLIKLTPDCDIEELVLDKINSNISMYDFNEYTSEDLNNMGSDELEQISINQYNLICENEVKLWNETQTIQMPKQRTYEQWKEYVLYNNRFDELCVSVANIK